MFNLANVASSSFEDQLFVVTKTGDDIPFFAGHNSSICLAGFTLNWILPGKFPLPIYISCNAVL